MASDVPLSGSEPGAGRFPDIIGRIKDSYAELRPSEQAVANAVLADVSAAVEASNADIAGRAGVSEPSVTRFCRAIGCEGVRDFKIQLARSLAVGQAFLAEDAPIATTGETPPFWDTILGEARAAIRAVERQVDPGNVVRAAESLAEARQVVTLGLGGSSSTIAEEAQVRLFRYGLPTTACREAQLARMSAATMKPRDVLLAISATGRTPEVLDTVEIAQRYKARVVALTRPGSALAEAADIALGVEIAEHPDTLTPTASRYAFLAMLDLVSAATGYRLGATARENLRRIKFNIMDPRTAGRLEPLGD